MEDGLVPFPDSLPTDFMLKFVLILVVVEDGLVPLLLGATISVTIERVLILSCSGRWSRTRPYKTILIINKLKNSAKQFFTFLNRKLTFP